MKRLASAFLLVTIAAGTDSASAQCSVAPRVVLETANCPVGQSCQLSLRLEPGTSNIGSVAARLVAGGLQCGSCSQGAAAPGASCFLNSSTCALTVADLAPPLTAFAAGTLATVEVTCLQPGPHVVSLTGVTMGGINGLPVENSCGQGATIHCTSDEVSEVPVCGDVNLSGRLTSSDALAVLKSAVGQPGALLCQPAGQTLETGQTSCVDSNSDAVSCAGTGQDGERRDGLARQFLSNTDGTIVDELTGLMWEKLSDDDSIHDHDSEYDWQEAITSKIAALNASSFAGHNDWRLPNVNELLSLVDYGQDAPATFASFDEDCAPDCTVMSCSCTSATRYWSSTPSQSSPGSAWTVDFDLSTGSPVARAQAHGVRAVRSAF